MPVLLDLKNIVLRNNELTEIGIETLLEKCPNLRRINFDKNKLSCERQSKIVEALEANNIRFESGYCVDIEYLETTTETTYRVQVAPPGSVFGPTMRRTLKITTTTEMEPEDFATTAATPQTIPEV